MGKPTNSLCKELGELNHQEQRALLHKLERRFQGRQFASKEEGDIAVRAAISEFLGCSPRMQLQPNFVSMMWFGLVVALLAGIWLYRSRWQSLGQ